MTDAARRLSFRDVWLWPIAIALSSGVGLASALVGDGAWDVLSWFALAPPLAVSGFAWARSRRGPVGE